MDQKNPPPRISAASLLGPDLVIGQTVDLTSYNWTHCTVHSLFDVSCQPS